MDVIKEPEVFELGLVLAGGVSAGSYTAGVLDFLLQALEAWETQRNQPDVPSHRVQIKVAAGGSAGGIVAAMLARLQHEDFPAVTTTSSEGDKKANKLYDVWVNQLPIENFLTAGDLAEPKEPVRSLLNSKGLDPAAKAMFDPPTPPARPRPEGRLYFSDTFIVVLTLSNLRGVPYKIAFAGTDETLPYTMNLHADLMTFKLPRVKPLAPELDALMLNPNEPHHIHWNILKDAAFACGAFPFAFTPRWLKRPHKDYDDRRWPRPYGQSGDPYARIQPDWPPSDINRTPEYEFPAVDGGMIDNEPLSWARYYLEEKAKASEAKRQGEHGDNNVQVTKSHTSAVILVDPLPNTSSFSWKYEFWNKFSLWKLVGELVSTLRSQSSFKFEELARAMDPDNDDQFMIAPRRSDKKPGEYTLASERLMAFAGFLEPRYLDHDFHLGRRNAQAFLRNRFMLPEKLAGTGKPHPLFEKWPENAKNLFRQDDKGRRLRQDPDKRWYLVDSNEKREYISEGEKEKLTIYLPLIPLIGESAKKLELPTWPLYDVEKNLPKLNKRMRSRANALMRRLIAQLSPTYPHPGVPLQDPSTPKPPIGSRIVWFALQILIWFVWWAIGWYFVNKATQKAAEAMNRQTQE